MSPFGPIDLTRALEIVIILLISIDVHELAHAIAADKLGDSTPRRLGQLSLNPFVHMDQVGIILLIFTALSPIGFTYGRTNVSPNNFKYGPQRGGAIVAIVGPLANLVLAAILGAVLYFMVNNDPQGNNYDIENFVFLALRINVLLFLFNLLPIPPLDGFTVLGGFLSARQMYQLAPLQQWGPLVLILLFVTNAQTGIYSNVMDPAILHVVRVLCYGCIQV